MATLVLTVSSADATRIQNAATGLGFTSVNAMIAALVKTAVTGWEQSQQINTYTQNNTPPSIT